jgi:hypothetical protein
LTAISIAAFRVARTPPFYPRQECSGDAHFLDTLTYLATAKEAKVAKSAKDFGILSLDETYHQDMDGTQYGIKHCSVL